MFDFVLSTAPTALATYWPICAAIIVVAVAVTHHTRGPAQRFAIGGAIVASCIGTLIIAFSQPGSPLVRDALRSEAPRAGNACVSTSRYKCTPIHYKKTRTPLLPLPQLDLST